MRKVSELVDQGEVGEEDRGRRTDGSPVVKATPAPPESPYVGTTFVPTLLPASPRPEGHRGILQAGSCFLGAGPSFNLVLLTLYTNRVQKFHLPSRMRLQRHQKFYNKQEKKFPCTAM